jgi:hypothetical protein
MIINRSLNITLPVQRSDGATIHVHSTPISREVFKQYYMPIAKAFSRIYEEGVSRTSAARVAAMMLEQVAKEMHVWEGPAGVERGLMAEMRRLTNVLVPTGSGWDMLPLHDAVAKDFLDEDDVSEVENCLVFFTVMYSMHKKVEREPILNSVLPLWDAQTTSLSCTEFVNSLPTSTAAANTGETKKDPEPAAGITAVSSVPC